MDAVFLGMNEAGQKVYNWLNQRDDVDVLALLTEKEQLSLIKQLEPSIVISSGFEHKVPKKIIEIPEKGIINLHPSFLPYNRGAHPYIWPIIDNTPAGVSIHYMNEEIDQGKIIDRKEVPVFPEDTAKTLHEKLMREQFEHFKNNWDKLKEDAEAEQQNEKEATKHTKEDLDNLRNIELDEEVRVGEFLDRLRALSYPPRTNAYIEKNGVKYFVELNIASESTFQ